jgi:general secretion pathway protein J
MKPGFTLLEMLVVLVLVGLISTLLLQGFSYVLHLRTRFLIHLENAQQGALKEYWFRGTVAAILADYKNGEHIFQGNERQLTGLTIAPLDNVAGVPSTLTWQLQSADGMTILNYQNSRGESWEVARWQGNEGHFSYRAVDGKWYDQWPPKLGMEPPQLPRLIVLEGIRHQTPFTWVVKMIERDYSRWDVRKM